jgi:hypothetical protein
MAARFAACVPPLEHDPEKWIPVFGKDHAPMQNPRRSTVVFGYDGEAEGGVDRLILSCHERV